MNPRCDIAGTRAFAAITLKRTFFGFTTIMLSIIAVAALMILSWEEVSAITLIVSGAIAYALIVLHGFVVRSLMEDRPVPTGSSNLADALSVDIVAHLKVQSDCTAAELLTAATASARGAFILLEMGTERRAFLSACMQDAHQMDVCELIAHAQKLREDSGEIAVSAPMIIAAFVDRSNGAIELLNTLDLSIKDLLAIVRWERFHMHVGHHEGAFSPQGLVQTFGGMGKSWILGYTTLVDAFTEDWTDSVLRQPRSIILSKKEMESAFSVLARATQRNILVLGRRGVGKHAFLENLLAFLRRNELERGLPTTRIFYLKVQELLAGLRDPDAFFLAALKEIERTGRSILVVPDLSLLLSTANQSVRSVLLRFLDSRKISVLAVADVQEYMDAIRAETSIDSLFEKVRLEEPTDDEVLAVLMEQYFTMEGRVHVAVTYKALKTTVSLCRRYLGTTAFPGKAIGVLMDAIAAARRLQAPLVTDQIIRDVVSLKANVNVHALGGEERDRLVQLESLMSKRIVGQRQAIVALVQALRRARLEIGVGKRPLGTFLFLGPTGVGKTETAKVLAREYFGAADRMIRLDMNEYATEESVTGIVGSPDPGHAHAEGFLAKRVQEKPFSLILLDEIEKAHTSVRNLFLQILDEGQLIDHRGIKTDFRNTIIIATSNAAALAIRDYVTQHDVQDDAAFKKTVTDAILSQGVFSPEFLNRFDDVILFHPLSQEEALQVANLMLANVVKEFSDQRGITVTVEQSVLKVIVAKGYSREFGARSLRRAVVQEVENALATYMLTHEVKRGDTIVLR